MYVEKMIKKSIIGVILTLTSQSVFADIEFDVLYESTLKLICTATDLKLDANQTINVIGFKNCSGTSSSTFSKQSSNISAKSLSVEIDGTLTKFDVTGIYAGLDADGNLTNPKENKIEIKLTLPLPSNPAPVIPVLNGKIIEIDSNMNGETHLPGCVGLTTTPSNQCRGTGSIRNETYAVRLNTALLASDAYVFTQFFVRGITNDNMANVKQEFRKFIMAISTQPGDFSPANPACQRLGIVDSSTGKFSLGLADLSINVMSSKGDENALAQLKSSSQKAITTALSNLFDSTLIDQANLKALAYNTAKENFEHAKNQEICLIDPDKVYYANVRPLNSNCAADLGDGKLTSPNGDCRIEVFANLPTK